MVPLNYQFRKRGRKSTRYLSDLRRFLICFALPCHEANSENRRPVVA